MFSQMSIVKINKVDFSAEDLRDFAKKRFSTIKNMADAMGISPPQLHAYLSGKRNFGASFREKLAGIGFFEDFCPEINEESLQTAEDKQSLSNSVNIDLAGAIELSNTPASRLAQLVGVSPATLDSWRQGTATPTVEELSRLFNQVVALALSSRHATTTQAPAEPESPRAATA